MGRSRDTPPAPSLTAAANLSRPSLEFSSATSTKRYRKDGSGELGRSWKAPLLVSWLICTVILRPRMKSFGRVLRIFSVSFFGVNLNFKTSPGIIWYDGADPIGLPVSPLIAIGALI